MFAVDAVGWFAKWSTDCFNYKHTRTSLIILFWLRMSQYLGAGGLIIIGIAVAMVLHAVPSTFSIGWVILWTNGCLMFFWLGLSHKFHRHFITVSVNVLAQRDIERGRPTKI